MVDLIFISICSIFFLLGIGFIIQLVRYTNTITSTMKERNDAAARLEKRVSDLENRVK